MRKVLLTSSILLIVGMLAGCMEMLPFDLGSSSEGPDEMVEEVLEEDENVEEDVDQIGETDMTEEVTAEEGMENGETADEATTNQCPEADYGHLTENLEPGFYIPDCAVLNSVSKDASGRVHGYLMVENGDWEDIYHKYKEWLEGHITTENLNIGGQSAELQANLYESENLYTIIKIDNDENLVHINIYQDLPE